MNMDQLIAETEQNITKIDARAKAQGVLPHDRMQVAIAVYMMAIDLAYLHGLCCLTPEALCFTAEMQDDEIEVDCGPRVLYGHASMVVEVDARVGQVRGIFDADAHAIAPAGRGLFVASQVRAGHKFVASSDSVFGAYCELAYLINETIHHFEQ